MGIRNRITWERGRRKARQFPARFEEWLIRPSYNPGDPEKLLAAFLHSGGSALSSASEKSATRSERYAFDDKPSSIGLHSGSHDYKHALTHLRKEGFAILPWRLDDSWVEKLSQHLEKPKMTLKSDDPMLNGKSADLDLDDPLVEKYDVPLSHILTSPHAVELMLDRGVMHFAQDYLGSLPQIDICASWFSFPVQRASSEAATMFHFDLDRTRWLKVFFFLTDVTPSTGAHVFLPGTHRDGGIPLKLRKLGYNRISDALVRTSFPQESWKTISGQRGTILIEDTRGIHKGLPIIEGHRLVLQFQYSQNLFGSKPSVFLQSILESSTIASFAAMYPQVLQGMTGDFALGRETRR